MQLVGDARERGIEIRGASQLEVAAAGLLRQLAQPRSGFVTMCAAGISLCRPIAYIMKSSLPRAFTQVRSWSSCCPCHPPSVKIRTTRRPVSLASASMLRSMASQRNVGLPNWMSLMDDAHELVTIADELRTDPRSCPRNCRSERDPPAAAAARTARPRTFSNSRFERHAAARVEHDHDRDRLHVALEDRQRLKLAVVVDLEVLLLEVRHEPAGCVDDRRVDRHRPGRGAKRRALRTVPGPRRATLRRAGREQREHPCHVCQTVDWPTGERRSVSSLDYPCSSVPVLQETGLEDTERGTGQPDVGLEGLERRNGTCYDRRVSVQSVRSAMRAR